MLYETITNDMKEAMKSKDKDALNTLRLLKSAIDLYLVNNKLDRNNASDEVVIDVVSKQVKTHKESIEEFKKANRTDLVEGLEKEIALLTNFISALPFNNGVSSFIKAPISFIDVGLTCSNT